MTSCAGRNIEDEFGALRIASLQYPHMIEHDGALWIVLSRCKLQTEIFRVSLDEVDQLRSEQ